MTRKTVHLGLAAGVVAVAAVALAVLIGRLGPDTPSLPAVTIEYPFDGAVFPPDIVAPTFRWRDPCERSRSWRVTFEFTDGAAALSLGSGKTSWRPTEQQWETIKRRSLARPVRVTVAGVGASGSAQVLSRGSVAFSTSPDEVGAPIFYREVNLPFLEAVKDPSRIRWRFGPVSSRTQPPAVLSNLPTCGNCHSFSVDGTTLGMDVDSASDKGSYVIAPVRKRMVFDKDSVITWSDYRRDDGELTFGLLAQISPDGRHAVSMVKDRHLTVGRPELMISQLFFPVKGILAIYTRATKTFRALPGADDRQYVHGSPAWSPDGETIVFARARARELKGDPQRGLLLVSAEVADEFIKGGATFKFDLYRVPFNDGNGGRAEPVEGASHNGMSNYFPKVSPDGKWIVFCKARSFMLLQPDSELYIVPAEGGQARRMRCNLSRLNSWHSWSPNGRWLVFSSKVHGPYTQLFLTHVDADGNDSPPVLLERFTYPEQRRAANIPEFVNVEPDAIESIGESFLDYYSYYRAGTIALQARDAALAARQYARAVQLSPEHGESHFGLGVAHRLLGQVDEAIAAYTRAAALLEKPAEAYSNLGDLQLAKGRVRQAVTSFTQAIRHDPKQPTFHYNLGVACRRAGRTDDAVAAWEKTIALRKDYVEAYVNLGAVHLELGRTAEALQHLNAALALAPDNAGVRHTLAAACSVAGDFAQAVAHERAALRLAEAAGDESFAGQSRAALDLYRQGKPFGSR